MVYLYEDHTCLKEIGLRFQILLTTPHTIVKVFGRTYVFSEGIQQACTFDNYNFFKGKSGLKLDFCLCFIKELLQHKFC